MGIRVRRVVERHEPESSPSGARVESGQGLLFILQVDAQIRVVDVIASLQECAMRASMSTNLRLPSAPFSASITRFSIHKVCEVGRRSGDSTSIAS